MLIDTHCHLALMKSGSFPTQHTEQLLKLDELTHITQFIHDAKNAGITRIINVGVTVIESKNCIILAQNFEHLYATVGVHPSDCTPEWRTDMKELAKLLAEKEINKIVAVGECGLDFYRQPYDQQRQVDVFNAQIELALEHKLPLSIHTRNAGQETLRVLEQYKHDIRGVVHCFSEGLDFAYQVIEWNLFLGIGGTITYPKNDTLRHVVQTVGLQHIVLETDAPFLPPQHIRGKLNTPSEIKTIAEYIAQLLGVPSQTVAHTTSINASDLFKISL